MIQSGSAGAGNEAQEGPSEEFGELLRFTVAGYVGGLVLGGILDLLGFQRSAVGQWLVRTISGEGESLLEGIYALRRRLQRRRGSMAEAYGWGKLIGMTIPWWIDWGSRFLGVDVYGTEGFYIPFFYALADQIGGNVSGFVFLRRRSRSFRHALGAYLRHPVMLTGVLIILLVPAALLVARFMGFSPTTQVLTALETMLANLCWIPPAVGAWSERRRRRSF